MNLIENIQRINTLISEDRKSDTIKNMIDKVGILQTIKIVGGLSTFEELNGLEHISNDEKIEFIKNSVNENPNKKLFFGEDFGYKENMILSQSKNHRLIVKALLPDTTFQHNYLIKRGRGIIGVEYLHPTYEDLPKEHIDIIFTELIKHML